MSCSRRSASSRARRGADRGGTLALQELARLRQAAYRLFGGVLLYPDGEWMATFPRVAEGLLTESRPLSEFAFWGAWVELLGSLRKLSDADRPALEAAYVSHFAVTADGIAYPPYESAYLARGAVGWLMADLEGEYARAGFSVDPAFKEPPDHAAVELEFMSVLCGEEAEAWRRRSLADGVERLDREASFLDQHLGRWFPELVRQLARRDRSGFYTRAASSARTFVAHDMDLVAALRRRFSEVA